MKSPLDRFRELPAPEKKEETQPMIEAGSLVSSFMDSAPASPPLQDKPELPEILQPFKYLYRMAIHKQMPDDHAISVIEAVEEAANIVLGVLKGRIWQETLQERLTELAEADAWFTGYWPHPIETEGDPYATGRERITV